MAFIEGHTGSRSALPDRLVAQAPIRFSQTLSRAGWPDFVFAFHDRDEIGPRILMAILAAAAGVLIAVAR